jgi:drug/metabolite transporter (DMT)-like permease
VQNKKVSQKALVISIIVSMFFWGLSWPSGKVLTHYLSVVDFTVCRYFLVVITLFLMLVFAGISMKVKKGGIPSIVAAGLLLALYSYFFYMGLKTGSAGAGGVLVTTLNPIMSYTIGILISRRWPSLNESVGLILGIIAGSFLLKLWDSTSTLFDSGNIYFLLAAFTWASMSKITSRGGRYGSSLSFSLWQYLVTLLCLLPLLNAHEFSAVLQIRDQLFWWNLFFSSAIVTSLATTVYFYATTRLGAEKASSFIFMVPLAAAVSAWLLLGERILPHTIIGGILGMGAVYMINKKTMKHKAVSADV